MQLCSHVHLFPCPCPGASVLYVRAARTSLLRAARTEGTGQLALAGHCCTHAVCVPASGVPHAPRTVAPQALADAAAAGAADADAARGAQERRRHYVRLKHAYIRLQPPIRTVAAPFTCGCSLRYVRLQPHLHAVAASATYGCGLRYARLQPPPHTMAACATCGYSLCHIRSQPPLRYRNISRTRWQGLRGTGGSPPRGIAAWSPSYHPLGSALARPLCLLAAPQLGSCGSSARAWRLPLGGLARPGQRPGHWAPRHRLSCSSSPPPKPPTRLPLAMLLHVGSAIWPTLWRARSRAGVRARRRRTRRRARRSVRGRVWHTCGR